MSRIKVLDLYCGFGGLSLGFEMTEVFEVVGGIDFFPWAVKTFYHNHPHINAKLISQPCDMTNLKTVDVINDIGGKPDLIIGGPPCQGFSVAGKRKADFLEDPRNQQVFQYLRFIKEIKPKAFLMENVAGIKSTGQEKQNQLIDYLIELYEEMGYNISWAILNASDFRVPQNRKRFMMVGVLKGKKFHFPEPPIAEKTLFNNGEVKNTVMDALSDLPSPELDEPQSHLFPPNSPLQKYLRKNSEKIYNHSMTFHSPEMVEKLKKQGQGTRLYPNWNHSWYKLDPTKPSPAVKENHRAPFVHFAEPRATSPRECARLQTVPDSYIFLGTKSAQLVLIGNAVPAILAAHVATEISRQIFKLEPPIPWDAKNNPLLKA